MSKRFAILNSLNIGGITVEKGVGQKASDVSKEEIFTIFPNSKIIFSKKRDTERETKKERLRLGKKHVIM